MKIQIDLNVVFKGLDNLAVLDKVMTKVEKILSNDVRLKNPSIPMTTFETPIENEEVPENNNLPIGTPSTINLPNSSSSDEIEVAPMTNKQFVNYMTMNFIKTSADDTEKQERTKHIKRTIKEITGKITPAKSVDPKYYERILKELTDSFSDEI